MKSGWEFFIEKKTVTAILGTDYEFTATQKEDIAIFFHTQQYRDRTTRWTKVVATWIKYNVPNWQLLVPLYVNTKSNTVEWFKIQYGVEWKAVHDQYSTKLKRNLPNTVGYWTTRGYSTEQARVEISIIQKQKSEKSPVSKKGARLHSNRCIEYWINKGYTVDDAIVQVSKMQVRDLPKFIELHGEQEGRRRHELSIARRVETWNTKDKNAHAAVALSNTYKANGQEAQAIAGFLLANNIPVDHTRYGAPSDQFFQWIPSIGFRRYDLAVFRTNERLMSDLLYIMEFHGPGHLNFSEYNTRMENDIILTSQGKPATWLGTYGNSYTNDLVKRNHILHNFPNVKYCVMWVHDLNAKRFQIEHLS